MQLASHGPPLLPEARYGAPDPLAGSGRHQPAARRVAVAPVSLPRVVVAPEQRTAKRRGRRRVARDRHGQGRIWGARLQEDTRRDTIGE